MLPPACTLNNFLLVIPNVLHLDDNNRFLYPSIPSQGKFAFHIFSFLSWHNKSLLWTFSILFQLPFLLIWRNLHTLLVSHIYFYPRWFIHNFIPIVVSSSRHYYTNHTYIKRLHEATHTQGRLYSAQHSSQSTEMICERNPKWQTIF